MQGQTRRHILQKWCCLHACSFMQQKKVQVNDGFFTYSWWLPHCCWAVFRSPLLRYCTRPAVKDHRTAQECCADHRPVPLHTLFCFLAIHPIWLATVFGLPEHQHQPATQRRLVDHGRVDLDDFRHKNCTHFLYMHIYVMTIHQWCVWSKKQGVWANFSTYTGSHLPDRHSNRTVTSLTWPTWLMVNGTSTDQLI